MNFARTSLLLAVMTALFLIVGFLIGGSGGAIIAFLIALVMNALTYWNSDKLVLSRFKARQVDEASAPGYYGIVKQLARRADMPMPKVYIIPSDQPNAFATGRNPENAAVAATTGLLQRLSPDEVAGVMAHELAHVRNRDTLTMTITATLAGAISMVAQAAFFFGGFSRSRNSESNPLGGVGVILVAVLAPLAAMLVQMAISRRREYEADQLGAEISGHPLWLASALEKLEAGVARTQSPAAERNPAMAHLFIVNPLSGGKMMSLFSTHPSTADRVAALRRLAGVSPTASSRGPWG